MTKRNVPLLALVGALASCASSGGGEVRTFAVENRYELDVPPGARHVRAWFALPDDHEPLQEVDDLAITIEPELAGVATREVRDREGNRFLYMEASGVAGQKLTVATSFEIEREEARVSVDPAGTRPLTADETREMAAHLAPNAHVVIDGDIRAIAREVVGSESNPIRQARLVYDWVLENVTYWVKFPDRMKASPVGSSEYCLSSRTGNCTDFHSLYAAVARAAGLPTRMIYGSFFKGPLDGQAKDQSYHCWIEFWAPEVGWIPLDVAIADIFVDDFTIDDANAEKVALTVADGYHGPDAHLVEYYFGNLDARRVTWNRGRDLVLDPPARGGPVNALPKAYVEVDGVPLGESSGWKRTLTFREL